MPWVAGPFRRQASICRFGPEPMPYPQVTRKCLQQPYASWTAQGFKVCHDVDKGPSFKPGLPTPGTRGVTVTLPPATTKTVGPRCAKVLHIQREGIREVKPSTRNRKEWGAIRRGVSPPDKRNLRARESSLKTVRKGTRPTARVQDTTKSHRQLSKNAPREPTRGDWPETLNVWIRGT